MARFPRLQANDDLVAARRCFRQFRPRRDLNVNVVDEPRIVRHDIIKIGRVLQRSDDGIACTLENANHAPFTSIFRCLSGSDFVPSSRYISTDARYDAIAVHRSPGILCRDENVRRARFFWNEKAVARLMDRQLPGD